MASFALPEVTENRDGWGPVPQAAENVQELPFAFFKKDDRLGRAADWTAQRFPASGTTATGTAVQREDEETFRLVDNTRVIKPQQFGRAKRFVPRGAWQAQGGQQSNQQQPKSERWGQAQRTRGQQPGRSRRGGFQSGGGRGGWGARGPQRIRQSHLDVRPDWQVVSQFTFSELNRLTWEPEDKDEYKPVDLVTCGQLEFWNKDYDRVTPKSSKPLGPEPNRTFFKVTTTEDPIIRQLATENAGNVFATDAILSLLMACPRSVYPWDIVVQRVGENKLFLDKRDSSQFDFLTVNETSQEPPADDPESINGMQLLSQEATYINQSFSQQILKKGGKTVDLGDANPFATSGEVVAPVGYKYRKWDLGDDMTLVARCEIDAVAEGRAGEGQLMLTVKALNEFDPKITGDWRRKIDTQRGAVLATEMKNNGNKLAKWTAQALLAGVDFLKLGYVSRVHPKDNTRHAVLGTQSYKPLDFAQQMNLSPKNMWGILRAIIELCLKLDEGKYVLLKDANKQIIRLYAVPDDTFAEQAEESDEQGSEDEDADVDDM